MKIVLQRIITGWTLARFVYLGLGSVIMFESLFHSEWLGVVIGGYFAVMGLFGLGCASGACYGGSRMTDRANKNPDQIEEVEFEEIKTK